MNVHARSVLGSMDVDNVVDGGFRGFQTETLETGLDLESAETLDPESRLAALLRLWIQQRS